MRIGVVTVPDRLGGGVYQYSVTMLHALYEWTNNGCDDEFTLFATEPHIPFLVSADCRRWTIKPLNRPSWQQKALDVVRDIVGEGPPRQLWRWMRRRLQRKGWHTNPDIVRFKPEMTRWFRRCGVDVMLYPMPHPLSFEAGIPYVMAIHDIQHRLQPQFPEVSANGEWECREYCFRNGTRHATLLLADSEVGKEDILNFYGPYGVTPDRVKVLPFLPACYPAVDISASERLRVQRTYDLPESYLVYPAQFWPHKNHARVIQALGLLKQEHRLKIPVVFCGSHTGEIREHTFREVRSLSFQLGLEDEVHYLGYVPDEDMSGLYGGAVALVMPTFFGPTNIPVLEAWAFACPVLTSDIRGIREQVGDAAMLVDPRSVESIADGIYRIWTDEKRRRALIDRGRKRLSTYTPDDYLRRLRDIVEEAKRRACSEKPGIPKQ